jgi:putative ABC transport system ATP-binding protein
MIQLEDVSKIFESPLKQVEVLIKITLEVKNGEFIVVKGPSGSGKTTLLLSIGGMLRPTSGNIRINDKNIYLLSDRERTKFRALNIGFVFQMFYLIPYLNVLENTMLSGGLKDIGTKRGKALQLAEDLGLSDRVKHRPSELSAGECQRVALARALIHQPEIILADEPTGNLDKENSSEVVSILADYHKNGGTVIMATHGDDADKIADRIILLNKGEI